MPSAFLPRPQRIAMASGFFVTCPTQTTRPGGPLVGFGGGGGGRCTYQAGVHVACGSCFSACACAHGTLSCRARCLAGCARCDDACWHQPSTAGPAGGLRVPGRCAGRLTTPSTSYLPCFHAAQPPLPLACSCAGSLSANSVPLHD
jgi:hypothetical protein